MKLSLYLMLVAIVGVTSAKAANIEAPRALVEKFLSWESRVQPSGAYRGLRTAELNALLSTELQCLLDAAVLANEQAERTSPDEKPPFIEGNLFLPSAWERPLSAEIVTEKLNGQQALVEVRFQYKPNGSKYTSKFSLVRHAGDWKISDIARGGECDFCQSGSIRESLYDTLRDFPKSGANSCRKQASPSSQRATSGDR